MVDLFPNLLFVIDAATLEIIYINRSVEQLPGLEADYVYDRGQEIFKQVLHPDDYRRRMENLALCRQLPDHKESEVEVRLKSAGGNWNWFRMRDKVFKRNSDGTVSQIMCMAHNIHEKKIADEKLKEEHRRLKEAQAMGHIGSFEREINSDFLEVSEEFYRIHGLEPKEEGMSLKACLSFIHPDDREAWQAAILEVGASGKPFDLVNRIIRPDGSTRHVHRKAAIHFNEEGIPLRMYGTIQDITDKVAEEEKTRERKNLMLQAEEAGSFGSYKLHLNNMQLEVSDGFYRLFGYEAGGFKVNTEFIDKVSHPDDVKEVREVIDKAIKDKQPYVYHRRVYLPGGKLRQLRSSGTVICNPEGNATTLIGIVQDITPLKKAEQEIIRVKEELARQATDRYLRLFNSIEEGFCLIEMIFDEEEKPVDFRYLDTNPAFEKQTGLENVTGRTVRELVPDIETFLLKMYGKVALTGESVRFDNYLPSMGRWFDVKAFPVSENEGRQLAVLFSDITERKQREANLSFLNELSEQLTPLSEPGEVMDTAGRLIGDYLKVSSCNFLEADEFLEQSLKVVFSRTRADIPSFTGKSFRISASLNEELRKASQAGGIKIIDQAETTSQPPKDVPSPLGIGSMVGVPYNKERKWKYLLSVSDRQNRQWRKDETELFQELTRRIFYRLERARVKVALRKSEAKYRELFNSIDQGFCIAEVIIDEKETLPDYRILEVNPRFQALTGISPEEALGGKTLRQIRPHMEEKWYQYGKEALSGTHLHFEDYCEALGSRWYEVNVFRTSKAEKRCIALLFNDISESREGRERIKRQNAVLEGINRIFQEALSSKTEEELGRVCLEVAEEVSGSRISFMGELNPETGRMDDIALSDRSWKEFGVENTSFPKKKLPAGLLIHGVYGRAILDSKGFFTNDPSSHPDSIGTPASHPELNSFLGVPLIEGNKTIGMVGLGNREGGYGPKELEMIEALTPAMVQAFLKKRTEEALHKSEEQFRAVADLVPDLLWSTDPEGNPVWFNRQWFEYTGLTPEGPMDSDWIRTIHPNDKDGSLKAFKNAVAKGEVVRIEHRIRRYDGAYRWFLIHARPLKNTGGKVLCWYGSATDVHEERVALETLRQSEEKFRFMADTIPQMIWIKDVEGNFIFFNKVFFDYTGAPVFPSSTQEVTDLYLHPEDVPPTLETWEKARDQLERLMIEHRLKSARGEYRWFLVRAEPYADPEPGKKVRWFGTSTDIHDNKLAEKALIKAKEEAEKAAFAKEEFLSTMSHEIRTPLNAVVGFTHLLTKQNPREDQKESLNGLSYSAQNLMSLINDILDFSKIEAGKVELEENEFDLLDLMFSLKQSHQGRALENGTSLTLKIDDEIPELIISDQLKLSQILHNLIGNAVKFTRQGQVNLDVKLKNQESQFVWLDFAVSDTGIGIAEDKIQRIFEKFSQADNSTIRQYGGTGLGLTITKILLELMGSSIEVVSQEGKGSRFSFTLRVKAGSGSSDRNQDPEEPEEENDLQQLKVLLVEDVDLNRLIITKFMKDWWDLSPDEALNGKEAVQMAGEKDYDLILMDVRMPEMNGYEATRQIREMPGYKGTPVIALTADTVQDIQQKPEAVHFTGVITKPFDPADLRRTILRYLPVKSEKRSGNSDSKKLHPHFSLKEVEKQLKREPEEAKSLYTLSYNNLMFYKETFKESLSKREPAKFGDMKHKATILLDTFRFYDVKAVLEKAQVLLEAGADEKQLREVLEEGESLFNQKIKEIQARIE